MRVAIEILFNRNGIVQCFRVSLFWKVAMNLTIEHEREIDGRWVAEVPELPGVLVYGDTAEEAMAKAEVLALRVLADRIETGEGRPEPINISFSAAA